MAKKHIITFAGNHYAVDSATAANDAIRVLSKMLFVRHNTEADDSDDWFYEPETRYRSLQEVALRMNQEFRDPAKPKKEKPLSLPKPPRGTIRCICNKSDVSPKQDCPHCGRPFSESHNRTHGDARQHGEHLRLL